MEKTLPTADKRRISFLLFLSSYLLMPSRVPRSLLNVFSKTFCLSQKVKRFSQEAQWLMVWKFLKSTLIRGVLGFQRKYPISFVMGIANQQQLMFHENFLNFAHTKISHNHKISVN